MYDFVVIKSRYIKKDVVEIYPVFRTTKSSDLMIKGQDFFAVWDTDEKLWIKDEDTVINKIDKEIEAEAKRLKNNSPEGVRVIPKYMWDSSSGSLREFHTLCQHLMRDHFKCLDNKVVFANDTPSKNDYVSFKLNYEFKEGSTSSFNEMLGTLYDPEEFDKIKWLIGSIITGDSIDIQKFFVIYGQPGSGKSTVIHILEKMFDGYNIHFNAKDIGSANAQFSMEQFYDNPLLAIQHDGDLSRITDNTKLNSIVSHEVLEINRKHKSKVDTRIDAMLVIATNNPVKITDSKSGLIRRLIDINPSGKRIETRKFKQLNKDILNNELGAIAYECVKFYNQKGIGYYDNYIPVKMMFATNDIYNFVDEYKPQLIANDPISIKSLYDMFSQFCDDNNIQMNDGHHKKSDLRREIEPFYEEYIDDKVVDGVRIRRGFHKFLPNKYNILKSNPSELIEIPNDPNRGWINFKVQHSLLDDVLADCKAQYINPDTDGPKRSWDNVNLKLKDLDTGKLHYVIPMSFLIMADFDIKDQNGKKNFELNRQIAEKFPQTYGELSKSGEGIHLYYYYKGDPSKLSRLYDENIEIKTFTGNASIRRMVTKCNDIQIATLNEGDLPLKEVKTNMLDWDGIKDEKMLTNLIIKCLKKEHHGYTTPEVNYIYSSLEEAYEKGIDYDLRELQPDVEAFCHSSSHNAKQCLKLYAKMHFCSKKYEDFKPKTDDGTDVTLTKSIDISKENSKPIAVFDTEVWPNLFILVYKEVDKGECVKLINPSIETVRQFVENYRIVGFNNLNYDNAIIYGYMLGYNNLNLYSLSKDLIKEKRSPFPKARTLSHCDLMDLSAEKFVSLKKWEIRLGIHHQENEYDWNKPLPEEYWDEAIGYCCNDVLATEALFHHLKGKYEARKILVKLANIFDKKELSTENDKTNTLTTRIIFRGASREEAQRSLVYTDLSTGISSDGTYHEYNKFEGYTFDPYPKKGDSKSYYLGEEINEGGKVYVEPGIYTDVLLDDVQSMHPHSLLALNYLGKYTENFKMLMDLRLAVKHKDFDAINMMADGALQGLVTPDMSDDELDVINNALKVAINSVYGLTSSTYNTHFYCEKNKDNIIAKRGALFMTLLKQQVQELGYTVAHIKTDSIKIPNYTPEIKQFISDFGHKYGYDFDPEAVFEKYCIVNKAVYICKVKEGKEHHAGPGQWAGTGTQFNPDTNPYVFKTLFSHEPIDISDMCETKSVTGDAAIYIDRNAGLPDDSELVKVLELRADGRRPDFKGYSKKNADLLEHYNDRNDDDVRQLISECHDYQFIGKVGQFCPMVESDHGSGVLYTYKDGKYSSLNGSKGYRWRPTEEVKALHLEHLIDRSYYRVKVDEAINDISQYCKDGMDLEWFLDGDPGIFNHAETY